MHLLRYRVCIQPAAITPMILTMSGGTFSTFLFLSKHAHCQYYVKLSKTLVAVGVSARLLVVLSPFLVPVPTF